ncbi:DUF4856 domain-containing protein [Wenyingzhuangia sp. IMCC45574]
MRISKLTLATIVATGALFTSCSDDNDVAKVVSDTTGIDITNLEVPTSYEFTRNNESTVSYGGQTTRLKQVSEIGAALTNTDLLKINGKISNMFKLGEGFEDASIDQTSIEASKRKIVRAKTAHSTGLFANGISNNSDAIKAVFDGYISKQVAEVFPNWEVTAAAGTAGVADGRYVNAKGLEYNQAFLKSLIGGLVADQILNHYTNRLDDNYDNTNSYKDEHEAGTLASGKTYTTMEHHWDEAYGYVYGVAAAEDVLLQKYINKVEGDTDFKGIAQKIHDAFLIGRAAVVAKNYTVRDAAVEVIREEISKVIAIRAVYYLQQGKAKLAARETAFHDLSEGYGFIYSLQFISLDGETPIFSQTEVNGFIADLEAGNGFWDVTATKLDNISTAIAAKFDFTVAQAAE